MRDFRNYYLGDWYFTISQEITDAATEYEDRCEAYDRVVCSGMKDGIAMPCGGGELGLINKNARKVRAEVLRKYHMTWKDLKSGLDQIRK